MAKYQKYAEYKDSGVEWLGDIPSHWAMNKLRYLFTFSKGLTITKENLVDEGVPCVNYGEVHSKYGFQVDPLKHNLKCVDGSYLKSSANALLAKGDFVFADTSEDLKGSGNFTHLVNNEKVFAGYHTVIARPQDATVSRFYAYLFDSQEFRSQIQLAVKGVKVFSITQAMLRASNIWLPSNNEKIKIANFLDYETAKIDSLIEKQKNLIELLKEKRQAVISHAVTKGLNPNVQMKDSGVEWLGQVPEHWITTRLKYLISSLESGCSVNATDVSAKSHEIGVLKTSCVYTRIFRVEENKTVIVEDLHRVKCKIRKGAIIISRMNTPDLVGASALVDFDADNIFLPDRLWQTIFNQSVEINSEYLAHFMIIQGFRDQIMLGAEGASSSMQNIAKGDYLHISCMLPPYCEQNEISEFLREKLESFKNFEIRVERTIKLLQERRTALISAVVTGKIDVRNWQNLTEAKTEFNA